MGPGGGVRPKGAPGGCGVWEWGSGGALGSAQPCSCMVLFDGGGV